jgi:hypothetical protein
MLSLVCIIRLIGKGEEEDNRRQLRFYREHEEAVATFCRYLSVVFIKESLSL